MSPTNTSIFQNSKVRYRSGKVISSADLKWHSGHPTGHDSKMGIDIKNPAGSHNEGLFNTADVTKHGVICERPL